MTTYVPYSQTAPQTTNLRELKLELDRVRDVYGPGSSQGAEAYQRLNREAAIQGRPLDGLRRFSTDEAERFFAQVIPGPDGHHYWDGSKEFRRNDGRYRNPSRYWWERDRDPIGSSTLRLYVSCGDRACINPEHQTLEHFNTARRATDAQLIGALQVMALRLGHTPSTDEWRRHGGKPVYTIYQHRFGSWPNSYRAAGLSAPPPGRFLVSPALCVKAIQFLRHHLNRWPSTNDVLEHRELLASRGLPSSRSVFQRHLGHWQDALKAAGKK